MKPGYTLTVYLLLIGRIVRMLSSTPKKRVWATGIPGALMVKIYSIKGTFNAYLLGYFTVLCVRGSPIYSIPMKATIYVANPLHVFEILKLAKDRITTLRWEDPTPETTDITAQIKLAKRDCPSLSSFWFCQSRAESWIQEFGSQIKSFEMPTGVAPEDIELLVSERVRLRVLHLQNVHSFSLSTSNLWASIGPTLEVLVIHILQFNDSGKISAQIRQIGIHCHRLKVVDIQSNGATPVPCLASCIASYGAQLTVITLGFITVEDLQIIVSHCPQAEINLKNVTHSVNAKLCVAGKSLRSLCIGATEEDLTLGFDRCVNLTSLFSIGPMDEQFLEALFNTPKPELKYLDLNLIGKGCVSASCMRILERKAVSSLGWVQVRIGPPSDGLFKNFVRNNKMLTNVHIQIINDRRESVKKIEECVLGIATCFLDSPGIMKLDVTYIGAYLLDSNRIKEFVRNICKYRFVEVQLLGYNNYKRVN